MCQNPQARPKFSKNEIIDEFEKSGDITVLTSHLCQLIDDTLLEIWVSLDPEPNYVVIATADYGRGELLPYSPVTILLLLPTEATESQHTHLQTVLRATLPTELAIDFSISSLETCLRELPFDLNKAMSLLGSRYLLGNKALFSHLEKKYRALIDPHTLFHTIQRETRQRHFFYEDTPYALEPNCVESPGGLSDLQSILRITQAANLGSSWQALSAQGLLTEHELRELKHSEKLLTTIRIHLHLISQSPQDTLTFELQPILAKYFGFIHGSTQQISEELMREYYSATKTIAQLCLILMLNIEATLFPKHAQSSRRLNQYFYECQGMIEIIQDDLYQQHPEAILETFVMYEQTAGAKGLAVRTLRALYKARNKMDTQWRNMPINRQTFIKILQAPQGVTRALRWMNQTGVLGRYLLSFRHLNGTMQHDLFYVYAVDQLTLLTIRNIRRFATLEYTHEFPFCSQLLANFKKPWLLVIVALFHNFSKEYKSTSLSSIEAKNFCRHHDLKQEDSRLVEWLVENHRMMTELAQNQELSNPSTILDFARKVGNERYLTALYLFTAANTRGINSKAWRTSQGQALEALYHKSITVLGHTNKPDNTILATRQEAALAKLCLQGLQHDAHLPLWAQLDIGFFLRHNADQIAWLTYRLWNQIHSPEPIAIARLLEHQQGLEVAIYAHDRPHLFAHLCGYFTQEKLAIVEACIHTTQHGYALDTFKLIHQHDSTDPIEYSHLLHSIETTLHRQLTQIGHDLHDTHGIQTDSAIPIAQSEAAEIPPLSSSIKPYIELRPDEQGEFFLLSFSANDRIGLLYRIAKVLSQYNISLHTARINTLETRATNVFLLKDKDLNASYQRQAELENALLKALFD